MKTSFKMPATTNSYQTKPLYTTLICFFLVFIPYFIIWILCWEFPSDNGIYEHNLIAMDTFIENGNNKSISWQVWTILFSLFGFYLILPWIMKLITLNHVNIDCSPFIYSTAMFCIMFIITWLIPLSDNKWSSLWFIGRFIISIVVGAIIFISSNKLINYILSNSSIGSAIAVDFKKRQTYEDEKHDELQSLKKKEKKEKEFVELEVPSKGKR